MEPLGRNSELEGSYIHVNSRVRWARGDSDLDEEDDYMTDEGECQDEEDDELGVYWSIEEKELFFHYLSRSSIHRLEEWCVHIPSKSRYEILAYYEVLQANLLSLKRLDSKSHGRILTKGEFPIAYEMDEFFVELEETMSARADEKLRILEEESFNALDPANNDCMIDFGNWEKRWNPIYSRLGVEEFQPASREALPISAHAMEALNQLVEKYLRRLLWFTVLPRLDQKFLANGDIQDGIVSIKSDIHDEDDEFIICTKGDDKLPHVVKRDDVLNGLTLMRQENLAAPALAETVLDTLRKFELNYEEGRLFRSTEIATGMVPRILAHARLDRETELYAKGTLGTPVVHTPNRSDDAFVHIHKKLFKLNGKKTSSESFIEDDQFDSIDNPLEQELCELEADTLDQQDLYESRIYQHALLTYLQGEKAPQLQLNVQRPDSNPARETIIPHSLLREFQYE